MFTLCPLAFFNHVPIGRKAGEVTHVFLFFFGVAPTSPHATYFEVLSHENWGNSRFAPEVESTSDNKRLGRKFSKLNFRDLADLADMFPDVPIWTEGSIIVGAIKHFPRFADII